MVQLQKRRCRCYPKSHQRAICSGTSRRCSRKFLRRTALRDCKVTRGRATLHRSGRAGLRRQVVRTGSGFETVPNTQVEALGNPAPVGAGQSFVTHQADTRSRHSALQARVKLFSRTPSAVVGHGSPRSAVPRDGRGVATQSLQARSSLHNAYTETLPTRPLICPLVQAFAIIQFGERE